MNPERVLSLDISTKTGWAFMISSSEGLNLESYGKINQISEPEGQYPVNYVDWAHMCFNKILELINTYKPEVLVIEETVAGSKSVFSQKILEWIHYLVAKYQKENTIKAVYFLTGQWRVITGCQMTNEEKKKNKEVRDFKKKSEKQTGVKTTVAYDKDGKRIGLVNRKHVNVRRANEEFGKFLKEPLRKKDEDLADALLLGLAYHSRKTRSI